VPGPRHKHAGGWAPPPSPANEHKVASVPEATPPREHTRDPHAHRRGGREKSTRLSSRWDVVQGVEGQQAARLLLLGTSKYSRGWRRASTTLRPGTLSRSHDTHTHTHTPHRLPCVGTHQQLLVMHSSAVQSCSMLGCADGDNRCATDAAPFLGPHSCCTTTTATATARAGERE
jgi:hypothetical protein